MSSRITTIQCHRVAHADDHLAVIILGSFAGAVAHAFTKVFCNLWSCYLLSQHHTATHVHFCFSTSCVGCKFCAFVLFFGLSVQVDPAWAPVWVMTRLCQGIHVTFLPSNLIIWRIYGGHEEQHASSLVVDRVWGLLTVHFTLCKYSKTVLQIMNSAELLQKTLLQKQLDDQLQRNFYLDHKHVVHLPVYLFLWQARFLGTKNFKQYSVRYTWYVLILYVYEGISYGKSNA